MNRASVQQAADWMRQQIEKNGALYQDQAAAEITARFGVDCTYQNDSGNLAISREILKEFRACTEGTVVWDSSERMWRRRDKLDTVGRRVN